jgi:hypothetical protein
MRSSSTLEAWGDELLSRMPTSISEPALAVLDPNKAIAGSLAVSVLDHPPSADS